MSRLHQGTTVDGRYKLSEKLGTGGMADVYAAEDRQLGRRVALKILHRHFAEDDQVTQRFQREASSAAGLSHPGIVGVYDRGDWDGVPYMAMEIVEGETLKDTVAREAPLEPTRAIGYAIEILRALGYAHRRGLVHRDVKPQNVLVTEAGDVKVADFGIARAVDDLQMTQTGMIVGTAHYLSPEQASGQSVTPAADLYAVGVVLFELLTGRLPFDGDQPVAIALKHANEEPPALSVTTPDVPADLEQIVLRALEKDPDRRYLDADEMIAVLETARERIASGAPEPDDPWAAAGYAAAAGAGVGLGAGLGAAAAEAHAGTRAASPSRDTGVLPAAGMAIPAASAATAATAAEQEEAEWQRRRERNRRRAIVAGVLGALAVAAVVLVLLLSGGSTRVPDVTGETADSARTTLREDGFEVRSRSRASASVPEGSVVAQDPAPGREVPEGTTVTLQVSSGPAEAVVPTVNGRGAEAAERALRRAGFRRFREQRQASDSLPEGRVVGTNPPGGTTARTDVQVVITVSAGPADGRVPDVVGGDQDTATQAIAAAGFTARVEERESSQEAGTVVSQTPEGGTTAESGSSVTIVVATEPEGASVPDVTGETSADARATLEAAGFSVSVRRRDVTDAGDDGRVVAQDPSGGRAERGSRVTITVGRLSGGSSGGGTGGGGSGGGGTGGGATDPAPSDPGGSDGAGGGGAASEGATGSAGSRVPSAAVVPTDRVALAAPGGRGPA